MAQKQKKTHSPHGSTFDSFLEEQGMYEEVTLASTKRILTMQIQQAMESEHISKSEMARRMQTSRAALDRLMDPAHPNVTLQTLDKAARAVGRKLEIALV